MELVRLIASGSLILLMLACGGSDQAAVRAKNDERTSKEISERVEAARHEEGARTDLASGSTAQKDRREYVVSQPGPIVQEKVYISSSPARDDRAGRTKAGVSSSANLPPVTVAAKNGSTAASAEGDGFEAPRNATSSHAPEIAETVRQLPERTAALEVPVAETSAVNPPAPPRRFSAPPPEGNLPATDAAPRDPDALILPEGTVIEIRTAQRISSKEGVAGDIFEATLERDLMVDGEFVFRRGSEVRGRLAEVRRPGKLRGRGLLSLELKEIRKDHEIYPLSTNSIKIEAETTVGRDAATIGAAAGIGAVLGAVFGGKKGAAVGSAAGGGAGSAGVLLTKGKDAEIPIEQLFSFRLQKDLQVRSD